MDIDRIPDSASDESPTTTIPLSSGWAAFLDIHGGWKIYALVLLLFLTASYSVFLIFGEDTIIGLGKEDGFFEDLTAVSFIVASIIFLKIYFSTRNTWFLLLALVFFVGFGEEISWGQRIFDVSTPLFLKKVNTQNEINIHNLKIFNAKDNPGIHKLHTISFLYKCFWFLYGGILPIAVLRIRSIGSIAGKMRLPVPPAPIGIFFLVNWAIFRITLSFLLPLGRSPQFYSSVGEIMECGTAFIFMALSIYFLNQRNSNPKWNPQ